MARDRWDKFVQEYIIDLHAEQAAIRAGYSPKTARQQGSRLLTKVYIIEGIAKANIARQKRVEIKQDDVLAELQKLGFYDIRKAVKWGATPIAPETEDDPDIDFDPNGLNIYPVALVPSHKVDDDTAAAITEVSLTQTGVKLKMADKRGALETMLRHLTVDPREEEAPPVKVEIFADAPIKEIHVTRPSKGGT